MTLEKQRRWKQIASALEESGYEWIIIEHCKRAFDIGYMTGEMDEKFKSAFERMGLE